MCNADNCNWNFSIWRLIPTLCSHLKYQCFCVDGRKSHFFKAGSLSNEWIKPAQEWQRDSPIIVSLDRRCRSSLMTVGNKYSQERIVCCDHQLTVPCRTSVSREMKDMQKSHELSMREAMQDIPGIVSFTTDTGSIRV